MQLQLATIVDLDENETKNAFIAFTIDGIQH